MYADDITLMFYSTFLNATYLAMYTEFILNEVRLKINNFTLNVEKSSSILFLKGKKSSLS